MRSRVRAAKSGKHELLLSNLALEVELDYRAPYLALEVPTVLRSSLEMPSVMKADGISGPERRDLELSKERLMNCETDPAKRTPEAE